jgi:hypothetical protein
LVSDFKYREILAACLTVPSLKMLESLICFPFNLDDLIPESQSFLIEPLTHTYFETLLDLDEHDFMVSLLARKLVYNKNPVYQETLIHLINHGLHLCRSPRATQQMIINFNRFVNQLLSIEEINTHLVAIHQLLIGYLSKHRGEELARNIFSVLVNFSHFIIHTQQQALFMELSVCLAAKDPEILKNSLQVLSHELLLKAHLKSGFLFLPLSFGFIHYQKLLEKFIILSPEARSLLLNKKHIDNSHYLAFILNHFPQLFAMALKLIDGLSADCQLQLFLNEDEFGHNFILSVKVRPSVKTTILKRFRRS